MTSFLLISDIWLLLAAYEGLLYCTGRETEGKKREGRLGLAAAASWRWS